MPRTATIAGVVAAVVGTASLAGCSDGPAIGSEGRFTSTAGATVTNARGARYEAGVARTLRRGDIVTVADRGGAHIDLPGGASLDIGPRSVVAVDRGPDLRSGEVLMVAPTGVQRLRIGDATLDASNGAARARVDFGLVAETYTGSSILTSGARSLALPALRAVSVPAAGLVPAEPDPIDVRADDEWDRRFLADVIDQREPLEQRARGFRGQLGSTGRTVGLYRRLLPALEQEPDYQQVSVDRATDAGEALLVASIAQLGRRGSFAERYSGALVFHGDGAPWALVAKDQGVPSLSALVASIDDAVNREANELALAQPTTAPTRPQATTSTTRPSRPPRSGTTPSTRPPSGPSTTQPNGTTPPPTSPPPALLNTLVDPVVELVNRLVGGG